MNALENSIRDFFTSRNITVSRDTFILACSGGIDSMVLARALLNLGARFSLAHCNFNLRGSESDQDQQFVEEFGRKEGLKVFVKAFDTKGFALKKKISTQMAARELRYTFFEELRKEQDFRYLLTAHHLDDSLETLLINLGRGTGFSGLKGISPVSGNTLRPLHRLTRSAILRYASAQRVSWREDSSNQKDDYQRNYIRLHVIPELKKAIPDFDEGFLTSLDHLEADHTFFREQVKHQLDQLIEKDDNTSQVSISKLRRWDYPSTLLYHWLRPYGKFDIPAIIRTLDAESGKIFEAGSFRLLKDRDTLILKKQPSGSGTEGIIEINDTEIDYPTALQFEIRQRDIFELPARKSEALLDRDTLQFPLYIRKWKPGDRFIPLGMKHFKKLSDFFIDEKFTRFQKEEARLLCSGNAIIWVIGHRIDDRFKVTDKTKTAYFVRLLK